MWTIESFARDSDDPPAEFDLDVLAADAVERLTGSRLGFLEPDQISRVAPLFDVDTDQWEGVAGPSVDVGFLGRGWLDKALAHLMAKVVGERIDDLARGDHLLSHEQAQWLVDRFSTDTSVPAGEIFVGFSMPWEVRFWRIQPMAWPLFDGLDLPDELGALTVDKWRWGNAEMRATVAAACDALRVAVQEAEVTAGVQLWLVALGHPIPPRPWVGVLKAHRTGLWRRFDIAGEALPSGGRSEVFLDWPEEHFGFAGSIRFPLTDLVVALEFTRVHNAVVVATLPDAPDPLLLLLPSTVPPPHRAAPRLLVPAVAAVADGTFLLAARANGAFDDRDDVGCDLFAHTPLLDRVEAALHADRPRRRHRQRGRLGGGAQ